MSEVKDPILQSLVENEDPRVDSNGGPSRLYKSVADTLSLTASEDEKVHRLAFERDPNRIYNSFIYVGKSNRVLADSTIKKMVLTDDLVGTIVGRRQDHLSRFGREQPNRSSLGFVIEKTQYMAQEIAKIKDDQKRQQVLDELNEKIQRVIRLISTCGDPNAATDKMDFSEYLGLIARNAVAHGRCATEIVYETDIWTGTQKFSYFRPTDVATIFKARPFSRQTQSVRESGLKEIERLQECQIDPQKWINEEYAWIQVMEDGTPKMAFTAKEMVCKNFYPALDVELEGYPVTPIDVAITSIISHISLTRYNKLYFESGRSAKGMLVLESNSIDQKEVEKIRQGFQAMITGNNNAHRMPLINIDKDDKLIFSPFETGSKDMEFQYLSDMTARIIFSAFGMSPDEITGWAYLSRGMSNQGLAESNNSFNLTATRDTAIRSLLGNVENYLNREILPLLDPQLADKVVIRLVGLDAETPEKESIRLQQDLKIHYTMDDVLRKVNKPPIGKWMGGELPFSPDYQAKLDAYFTVGEILEFFCGREGASRDPLLAYRRDPFWFQHLQFQQSERQMQQQEQMMQQESQQQQGGGTDGDSGKDTPSQKDPQQGQMTEQDQARGGNDPQNLPKNPDPAKSNKGFERKMADLNASIGEALTEISKSEYTRSDQMAQKQNSVVRNLVKDLNKEASRALEDMMRLLRPLK